MSHKAFQIDIENDVGWDWPLQIGFTLPDAHKDISTASSLWWSNQYGEYHIANDRVDRLNIIITRMSYDDLLKKNKLRPKGLNLQADSLIFLRTNSSDSDFNPQKDMVMSLIESYQSGSFSVVQVANENEFPDFLENFISELSHDLDLVRALEKASPFGRHIYGSQIMKVSKLSNLYKTIKSNLKKPKYSGRSFTIDNVKFLRDIDYETSVLIERLEDEEGRLIFDEEKETAKDIFHLNTALKNNIPGFKPSFDQFKAKDIRHDPQQPENGGGEASSQFLQARIIDSSFDTHVYLKPNSLYKLLVRFGFPSSDWVSGQIKVSLDQIFESEGKDEADVQIIFSSLNYETPQTKTVKIKRGKNSDSATFDIDTSAFTDNEFTGTISALHKGRIIQQAVVEASIVDGEPGSGHQPLKVKITASPRTIIAAMDDRQEFGTSLVLDESDGKTGMTSVANDKMELIYENSLRSKINDLRRAVEKVIQGKGPEEMDLYGEEFKTQLIGLARKGREFYDAFFKDRIVPDKPIQIVTKLTDYFPLDFIYTYPNPSKQNAKVCPNAKEALEKGKPLTCGGCIDLKADPGIEIVCPFGFVGLRNIIERYDAGAHQEALSGGGHLGLLFQPLPDRKSLNALNRTLHASSEKVDKVATDTTTKVKARIKATSKELIEVDDWTSWKDNVQQKDPDTLLLIVHTEEDDDGELQMEIGPENFLLKGDLSPKYLYKEGSKTPPLVILIGCNTTDTKIAAFDFTAQFINKGAAIVLSNFTKITGRKAGLIVTEMMDIMKSMKGKEISLGEIILKLRQQLMARGVLASMSLIAHGDADWLIKI